jgi:hypothetical protein
VPVIEAAGLRAALHPASSWTAARKNSTRPTEGAMRSVKVQIAWGSCRNPPTKIHVRQHQAAGQIGRVRCATRFLVVREVSLHLRSTPLLRKTSSSGRCVYNCAVALLFDNMYLCFPNLAAHSHLLFIILYLTLHYYSPRKGDHPPSLPLSCIKL